MKQERSAYLVLSALCNVAVEKQEGERFPLTFLQRYSVKIGYYSLFRYLGSLPRSKVFALGRALMTFVQMQALSWACVQVSVVKLEFKCSFCYSTERPMCSFFTFSFIYISVI